MIEKIKLGFKFEFNFEFNLNFNNDVGTVLLICVYGRNAS